MNETQPPFTRLQFASSAVVITGGLLFSNLPSAMNPVYEPLMEHQEDKMERVEKRQPLTPLEKEIQGAVNQMQQNIHAVGQRGERLDTLQSKTDHLSDQANGFRRGANRVRKQMWWKDMKMRMCIIVGIIILLIVIIVPSGEYRTPVM